MEWKWRIEPSEMPEIFAGVAGRAATRMPAVPEHRHSTALEAIAF
jgi:hypothetical protein